LIPPVRNSQRPEGLAAKEETSGSFGMRVAIAPGKSSRQPRQAGLWPGRHTPLAHDRSS
jgi:hypothetical protein